MNKELVSDLLDYDANTGVFTYKISRTGHIQAGRKAGYVDSNGYHIIQIDKKKYKAHRLAWLITYGELPNKSLDHKNGIKTDNRIENLRICTMSQNIANSVKCRRNRSGFKGVYWHKSANCWAAGIGVNGKWIYLGLFKTKEEAKVAYDTAAIKYFGEFARAA